MSKILAVEWCHREIRYVLAKVSGGNVRVLEAESILLEHSTDEEEPSEPELGRTLQTALAEHAVGRLSTLVSIGRSSVEMWDFALPPATNRELPDLVANLAVRESSSLTDDASLDFIPDNAEPTEPRHVTAIVLPAAELRRVHTVCEGAGLTPSRITLRPYAAASLFLESMERPAENTLLVNLVGDETDLTVISDGIISLSRTVRLPAVRTESTAVETLVAEIRRTLVVAPSDETGENRIEAIRIYGRPGDHVHLLDQVREELGLSVELLDPFDWVKGKDDLAAEDVGSFASLIGMVVDEARHATPAIDFLHPKKPPKPPNRKRPLVLAAVALGSLVAMGGYYVWDSLAAADAKNDELMHQLKGLDDLAKPATKKKTLYTAVRTWRAGNVNWLDELRDLSLRLPPQRDIVLRSMTIGPARDGGGTVTFEGTARSQSVVVNLENALRDEFHQIRTPRLEEQSKTDREHPQKKRTTWQFESTLRVAARSKNQYVSHQPEPPANDAKGDAETNGVANVNNEQAARKSN